MKKWSDEQAAIIAACKGTKDNILIESVAGSGKTSVLIEAAMGAPRGSKILAFNKKIADELQERLTAKGNSVCEASTFHSLCWQFLRERLPRGARIDKWKVPNLVDKLDFPSKAKWDLVKFVSLLKNAGFGVLQPLKSEAMLELLEEHGVVSEAAGPEEFVEAAKAVFRKNEMDVKVIDFDDMLYVALKNCLKKGWHMEQCPVIFLDEAQDTNEVQFALLRLMAKRLIAVGDSNQAIYAFRGAGANSMKELKDAFDCKVYPMSISWRCPLDIASIVQEHAPHFKARDDAPRGVVVDAAYEEVWWYTKAGRMILCRSNAPLFRIALKLLRERTAFQMTGKFPEQLIAFIKRFKTQEVHVFRTLLQTWWKETKEDLERRAKWSMLEREQDKFEALFSLQKECISVAEICDKLNAMMTSTGGVLLSTIHGAKGLEAKEVVFLYPELIPHSKAVTEEQLQQEYNMKYVAETRSQFKLVYVRGDADGKAKRTV